MKKIIQRLMRLWYSLPIIRVRLEVRQQDDRAYQWFLERSERGFDRRELWNLHDTISVFIRDRLKWFKEQCPIVPNGVSSHQQWQEILDDMIYSFDTMCHDWEGEIDQKRFKRGIRLFIRYYYALWY